MITLIYSMHTGEKIVVEATTWSAARRAAQEVWKEFFPNTLPLKHWFINFSEGNSNDTQS